MGKKIILATMLLSCTNLSLDLEKKLSREVTCTLDGFEKLPSNVTGSVTLELKNFITIMVENKKQTERIEITFPREKCK